MSLFEGNMKNKSILEKWIIDLGIIINPQVKIKETEDKGIGVFYNFDCNFNSNGEPIELIRIPQLSSYNIYTLKKLINDKLDDKDSKVIKRVLMIIFSKMNGNSESLILISYFIGFLLICNKEKKLNDNNNINNNNNDDNNNKWKDEIKVYLNILLNTNVGNLYLDQQDILQDFLSYFQGNAIIQNSIIDITSGIWVDITESINEEFSENFKIIKIEEVLQICSAIRSRVLEIPREIYNKEGDDDDYYVDVTLVPILDYVNHDNLLKNAYFDIDRETKDIILFYERKSSINKEFEVEVFISYDIFEDLHSMFINYGFLPISEDIIKVIEIPIIGYNKFFNKISDFDITRRLYCIKQSPNVQFKIKFDNKGEIKEMKLLLEGFYSFLVFKDDIDWNKFEEEDEEEGGGYEEEIDFEKGFNRSLQIMDNLNEDEINELQTNLFEYIIEFFKEFKNKSKIFKDLIEEYELNIGENRNISKLIDMYDSMSKFMLEKVQFEDFIECNIDDNELRGYLGNRMMPIYNFDATISGAEVGELKI
ncbi:cytochrome c lysine N-methyltransferase [Pichia californica]|uniref:Cytochrome c lysine N-methyltransferase n=1 Tax=Pichia californica TaxID=460514 RepID=A0A9P6WLN7_9ASCO|nr:cytochrome c lysine N-methyltransferase [[Candida] californica]KAG0689231.1 cytochrome c lysine N-methyltransferase [[Candida] californica]